jgi:hypothetical protein
MPVERKRSIEAAVLALAPEIPAHELAEVTAHALHSRGLRTAAAPTAAWLSLVAYVRHAHTDYEAMLADGYDVEAARHFCLDDLNAVLRGWGAVRQVSGADEEPAPE